ncbi:MAG TPA: DUF5684 domain-containing protein [Spirochaetota bacterium]|nr:DUF5684 domain-containing protein [Spirochaetota bacterium]HNT09272.1 DUF5684 domain-containing protein [Spirochaetota bacterium]HNV47284.1 DUF5684 domain-containing protein [Spirochaetota bacterium]HOS38775.1 DUF5684 domain-containing protein [Spirochaetota bacterium]HPU87895.1 DUF5684 domain-containing protein [Spirochaetota bacterium]
MEQLFAQDMSGGGGGGSIVTTIIYLIFLVAWIAGMWKVFEKAGKPGWAAIVPIYNIIVLLQIINKPLWWIVLMLIPIVNFIIFLIVSMELAVCFGKSKGWGVGLLFFFGFVGYPLLGFGDATYTAPAGS